MDNFDLALAEASEQGSGMWHDIRAGRFTSSEIWKLMESGTREMTPAELKLRPKTGKGSKSKYIEDPACISKTTETYIRTKVAEALTGQTAGDVFSHATAWGDDYEPVAAEEFAKLKGYDYQILSFVPYGDHAGGSPDRKVKGLNRIVEFKCPFNSANQVNYLMLTDQWDLKGLFPEHYWQCMANIFFCNEAGIKVDFCDFVTFDPRMKEDRHKLFHLEIRPIEEDIERIKLKLVAAIKEKLKLITIL